MKNPQQSISPTNRRDILLLILNPPFSILCVLTYFIPSCLLVPNQRRADVPLQFEHGGRAAAGRGERFEGGEGGGIDRARLLCTPRAQQNVAAAREPGLLTRRLRGDRVEPRERRVVTALAQLQLDGRELKSDERAVARDGFVKPAERL